MTADRPLPPDRVVLIHGAWVGAWVWDEFVAHLRRHLDAPVAAPDLPGCGDDPMPAGEVTAAGTVERVTDAMAGADRVALVAHAGGGMIATLAAEAMPERVRALVYVAGIVLTDGRSFDDVQQCVAGPGGAFGVTPHIRPTPDGQASTLPAAAAMAHLFHDCRPAAARAAAARLGPQPAAVHRLTARTGPGFAAIPKLYVETGDDRAILPAAQRLMHARLDNAVVRRLSSGHAAQMSRPGRLARMVVDFVQRAGTPART